MSKPDLKFIPVDKPGQRCSPEEAFELRSHVRRAVAYEKSSRPRNGQVRFAPTSSSKNPASSWVRRKKTSKKSAQTKRSRACLRSRRLSEGNPDNGYQTAETSDETYDTDARPSSIPLSLTCIHPFATRAAEHVDLPIQRLDFLFKTEAFRYAAEPLFDVSHVDSTLNLPSVFPTCLNNAAFCNAIAYSTLQSLDRGRSTVEHYRIKRDTLKALSANITSNNDSLLAASIATIMTLKVSAYKWNDPVSHSTHSRGLTHAIQHCKSNNNGNSNSDTTILTHAAHRALFWQDLFASLLISSPRTLSHTSLPTRISWRRTLDLPAGFTRYTHLLPAPLQTCILDTLELQSTVAHANTTKTSARAKYDQLDTMQADIESRLSFLTQTCRDHGFVAEAVRIALFIVVYTAWMETWNSSLVPGRLAEMLVTLLEGSVGSGAGGSADQNADADPDADADISRDLDGDADGRIWAQHRDLHLYLLFIGVSTAELDGGLMECIRGRYATALRWFGYVAVNGSWGWGWSSSGIRDSGSCDHGLRDGLRRDGLQRHGLQEVLRSALQDFAYPVGWRKRRAGVRAWAELEAVMGGVGGGDDDGDGNGEL